MSFHRAIAAIVLLASVMELGAQAPYPRQAMEPCAQVSNTQLEAMYNLGWNDGQRSVATKLTETATVLPIQLLVEEEATSYRLAAAEIIRTHFGADLRVVPAAPLKLYITATGRGEDSLGEVHMVEARVVALTDLPFLAESKIRMPFGEFVLARKTSVLGAFTLEQKTQHTREMIYGVISEFLKKWREAEQ